MNKWLTDNGYWCPKCGGTGRGKARDRMYYEGGHYAQFYDKCEMCDGEKRIAATPQQIIAKAVPKTPAPSVHTLMSPCLEYGHQSRD